VLGTQRVALAAIGVLVSMLGCSGGGGGGGGAAAPAPTPASSLVEPTTLASLNSSTSESDGVSGGSHPNLFLNQREIEGILMSVLANEQPISAHLDAVIRSAHLASAPDPDVPSMVYQGTNHNAFRAAFDPDMFRALTSAIAAQFPSLLPPGDREVIVANVRDYLVAWARHSITVTSLNEICASGECALLEAPLSFSVGMFSYIAAYDLVFDDPLLSETDHLEIRAWLERLYSLIRDGTDIWGGGPAFGGPSLCHRYSNHASRHIGAMAGIGYVLNDASKIQEALSNTNLNYSWSSLLRDSLYIEGDPVLGCDASLGLPTFTGEVIDRYRHRDVPGIQNDPDGDPSDWSDANRGLGYSLITMENLGYVAEMALHRGRDLFRASAVSGESLDLPGRYFSYFKQTFGTGRVIIEPTGYMGEISYTGEILSNSHSWLFEWLSDRYHQDADITRGLEPYEMLGVPRNAFNVLFFGRYYDSLRLAWNYHFDDVSEGWEFSDTSQVAQGAVENGMLSFESSGPDPALRIGDLFIDSERFASLVIRMRVTDLEGSSVDRVSEFAWQTSTGVGGSVGFMHQSDGVLREYRISLAGFPTWSQPGTRIVELRFDPVREPGLRVEIDAIILEVE